MTVKLIGKWYFERDYMDEYLHSTGTRMMIKINLYFRSLRGYMPG